MERRRLTSQRERLLAGFVVAVYLAARFVPMIGTNPGTGSDTGDYFTSSRFGLTSRDLWAGPRPALYPLIVRFTGRSYTTLFLLQAGVAVVVWLALAGLVYTRLRNRAVAGVTALAVLFASLSLSIVEWDRVLSTESLTISLGVVLLILGVLLAESPSWLRAVSFATVAAAWVLLRDTNGYVIVCIAIALVIAAIRSRARRRTFLAVAGALVVIFAAGVVSSDIGRRWEGPLKDVITIRVLTYPDRTQYMLDRGLPLSREERSRLAGHCAARYRPYFLCLPLTDARFYRWESTRGRSAYSNWLLSHPATALNDPIRNSGLIFGTRVQADALTHYRFEPASIADHIFFVRNQPALLAEALLAFALLAAGLRRRSSVLAVVVLVAFATVYPHMFVSWTFGALESTRHSLGASVTLALSIVLAVGCAVDSILAGRDSSVDV